MLACVQVLHILKQFLHILKIGPLINWLCTQPSSYRLTHTLFESKTEGAVAAVAAGTGQLLGDDRLSSCRLLVIETHEVVDTQVIDISIVGDALTREILAEI